ncbi:PP2C family protein-serine/threonine phosphatase [Geomicrobium sediminis]|uniref:Sigma-B regulation protein RsbU (Phosphoserine phosphatase) n=1 Tax=Geomicrobium sediminis TaxID=1347788 RepID=A0ABS2PG82_9BACL|nr:PP2C family protein-serine/threonine phosphatase [Geomicrobium sediminis]MBM7634445.1 sigma-B regulation protein RsbU (phosphoserine phosphatase) [Geomicrobium sediminis]
MDTYETLQQSYKEILFSFLQKKNEQSLYDAQQFSKKVLEEKVSPEEIVSIHLEVIQELYPDIPPETQESFEFLLEVMIGYGMAYREHQILRNRQKELENEIDVAANMQHTLLPSEIPDVEELDIGVITVPASKMSGDYYHVIKDANGLIGVAIADIIGKGIPAALCMSMIKYAMDSMPNSILQPGELLESLNRTIEQNIASHMFVTMMYGSYDPKSHIFYYGGAGHEPGFYYSEQQDRFEELYAKGLALGISKEAKYREFSREMSEGDFVVLLSDGVTECRTEERFIEREEITALIRKYKHLSTQKIVDNVYRDLERWQEFQLRDDFTLIIVRRKFKENK